jgi:hypothetical protein
MLFSYLGGRIQFGRCGEGYTLKELGLLEVSFREREFDFEVQPTQLLRRMCEHRPDLETLYPLLVEMVLCFRYSDPFANQRHVAWRLLKAGMTQDGVELLEEMLRRAVVMVW